MSVTVACPSCATRFKLDHNAIPEGGRMVKCSSCLFKWRLFPHQLHYNDKKNEEEEWSSASYSRIKQKQEKESQKKVIYAIFLIVFFWVTLFIITFFFHQKIIHYIPQMAFL